MLMNCVAFSQSDSSNWVMWQVTDPLPPLGGTCAWPRKNNFHKNAKSWMILLDIWLRFQNQTKHDDVIKWKHIPRNWLFVRGIHRSPVNSSHKGQWRGALMFSLICVWINDWVNNREAGDFRRYLTHYDVIVMTNRNIWTWWLSLLIICKEISYRLISF